VVPFTQPDAFSAWEPEEITMSASTAKQRVLEAIEKLPPDATVEDAIERLVFLAKIERGIAELDAGKGISHAEAKQRLLQ
jgi:predicted transcriptional regulator